MLRAERHTIRKRRELAIRGKKKEGNSILIQTCGGKRHYLIFTEKKGKRRAGDNKGAASSIWRRREMKGNLVGMKGFWRVTKKEGEKQSRARNLSASNSEESLLEHDEKKNRYMLLLVTRKEEKEETGEKKKEGPAPKKEGENLGRRSWRGERGKHNSYSPETRD